MHSADRASYSTKHCFLAGAMKASYVRACIVWEKTSLIMTQCGAVGGRFAIPHNVHSYSVVDAISRVGYLHARPRGEGRRFSFVVRL